MTSKLVMPAGVLISTSSNSLDTTTQNADKKNVDQSQSCWGQLEWPQFSHIGANAARWDYVLSRVRFAQSGENSSNTVPVSGMSVGAGSRLSLTTPPRRENERGRHQ